MLTNCCFKQKNKILQLEEILQEMSDSKWVELPRINKRFSNFHPQSNKLLEEAFNPWCLTQIHFCILCRWLCGALSILLDPSCCGHGFTNHWNNFFLLADQLAYAKLGFARIVSVPPGFVSQETKMCDADRSRVITVMKLLTGKGGNRV